MNPKEKTRKELELAIKRIQLGRPQIVEKGRKMSISAVAEEAGVSASLIHNSHSDIAELVRSITGVSKATGEKINKIDAAKIQRLRQEIDQKDEMLKKLAMYNLQLSQENCRLRLLIGPSKQLF